MFKPNNAVDFFELFANLKYFFALALCFLFQWIFISLNEIIPEKQINKICRLTLRTTKSFGNHFISQLNLFFVFFLLFFIFERLHLILDFIFLSSVSCCDSFLRQTVGESRIYLMYFPSWMKLLFYSIK